ncbi:MULTISPECIES: hypothetical protein [Halomonadaceae]|uniref:hypothetical protein n=1 Tax=Halomonadaceae TaxID=28256 RepID=UPI001597809E|nr:MULTISPECIES: hypothetical protein [Halomonas]QJQ96486.1 hypothetical protein HIO72_15270 [Halomonas sp. PA5]
MALFQGMACKKALSTGWYLNQKSGMAGLPYPVQEAATDWLLEQDSNLRPND